MELVPEELQAFSQGAPNTFVDRRALKFFIFCKVECCCIHSILFGQAWITTISLAICKAIDLLEMLKEEEMLSAVKERQLKILAHSNLKWQSFLPLCFWRSICCISVH
ncbi:hypothetical protein SADUNF_Sadunf12G0011400 [Salix dunnii]|uniref:Uncharacterized protein n=1 Tax=Salix dunnii TaxID=1413687 RepID=A0A835MVH6_9ROSI|nr:hypothetical protein SADUNF_Sadunf12G0011400 [Salix dunnii]